LGFNGFRDYLILDGCRHGRVIFCQVGSLKNDRERGKIVIKSTPKACSGTAFDAGNALFIKKLFVSR